MLVTFRDETSLEVVDFMATEESMDITFDVERKFDMLLFVGNPEACEITVEGRTYKGFTRFIETKVSEGKKILTMGKEVNKSNDTDKAVYENVSKQITDIQLAICEIFESIGGGNNG